MGINQQTVLAEVKELIVQLNTAYENAGDLLTSINGLSKEEDCKEDINLIRDNLNYSIRLAYRLNINIVNGGAK